MQLILRDAGHALVDPQQPARRQGLVHRYCPPSIGNLFAIARKGGAGGLEWWTELPGQPRRLDELTAAEQVALQGQLAQRLLALENLIGELERRHDPAAAELRELPTTAAPDTLYSVGGEPLLIRWVPVVPIGAATPAAGAAPRPPVPTPPPATRPRRRWVIPLLLPLLSVLALLGLWLAFQHRERFSLPWPQSRTPAETVSSRDADTPPAELVSQPVDDQRSGAEPVLGTGDIQVTLRWDSADDLDLAVIDPYGDIAFFNSPITASGGQLDVDSNAGCTPSSQAPVENVFWNSDSTPEGTYVATVSLFSRCSDGSNPIPFELSITLEGNTETQTGTVSDPSPRQSFEFSFPQGS
ncbi:MAG: hypothetical protein ACQEXO_09400 [Pseudomonadota bacterium]